MAAYASGPGLLRLVDRGDLSKGNAQALLNAYNYSVDMEERVAAMFNEAIRAWKARQ